MLITMLIMWKKLGGIIMSKDGKFNFVDGLALGIVLTSIVCLTNCGKKVDNAEATTSPCVETTASPYEEKTSKTELENAIESAEAYSNVFAYSKKYLIEQLKIRRVFGRYC